MIKKILYVGFQYEYGNKNSEAINNKGFFQNFKKLGYEINPVWYDDYSSSELEKIIITTANKTKPDIIFFILQENQVSEETLKQLKNDGHFMVNWFGDDQWRFEGFTSKYAPYFDVCLTTDKFSLKKYHAIGQKNVIRSQWASLESNVKYQNIKYKYDVSFVGGGSPFRRWFVKALVSKGINVHCFGSGWENGKVSYEEMEYIFSSSKINLNISNSIQYDIRYLLSNPRNLLNTYRSPKNMSQTKARMFEIPVQGGFELTEYVPTVEDYFDIGSEISCYRDVGEAELLIKHYLESDGERELIKEAGVKKARSYHTFRHRIEEFMSEVNTFRQIGS